ncbi:MAG: thiamine-phosphate kinase [Archaeoglobi archaeon]|nr:thiamine-phosphate kinase [Candidatus Mnemosynella bozhongmuii]
MKLGEIGERRAIQIALSVIEEVNRAFVPAGEDDCAVIEHGDELIVLTTDMVMKSTDFPEGSTFFQMGWKSVAVNLSDIASTGAAPLCFLASVGLPSETSIEDFRELFRGMKECCRKYRTSFIGGDMNEADEPVISGFALGITGKDRILLRRGAKPGDLLCVTGELGKGAASLMLGELETLNIVHPRVFEGMKIAESRCATAMTDISDSLAISIHEICEMSGVGARVYAERIPVHELAMRFENSLELALFGGDEYELVFTAREEGLERLEDIDFTVIGEITAEREVRLIIDGKAERLEKKGYEHLTEP